MRIDNVIIEESFRSGYTALVQLGGGKLPAEFPAARNSKSMVHAGTGRWRQKNGRPMLIVGSRLAVYRMAVVLLYNTLFSREENFAKSEFEIFSREDIFANDLYCSRENIFPRKYLPAKISSRENILARKSFACFVSVASFSLFAAR